MSMADVRRRDGSRRRADPRIASGPPPASTGAAIGDPIDTSAYTTGTQADEMLASQASRAQNLIAQGVPQSQRLEQISQSGFSRALGGLGSVLEFITRPMKVATLFAQDIAGLDEKVGHEIELGDYWNVVKGDRQAVMEGLPEELRGEHGDISTSQILETAWGWDTDDMNLLERTLRFGASMGGDILFDPLTYATFGASAAPKAASLAASRATISRAGREVLEKVIKEATGEAVELAGKGAARKGGQTAMEEIIEAGIKSEGDVIAQQIARESVEQGLGLTPNEIVTRAYTEASGLKNTVGVGGKKLDAAEGFAGGVVGDYMDKVAGFISNREFGSLKRLDGGAYMDHVFTKRNGQRLGEAWTTGGARLALPFSMRAQSRPLRATVGAFEDWYGLRALHKIPQSRVGKKFAQVMPMIDANAPLVAAARRGARSQGNVPANQGTFSEIAWAEAALAKVGYTARNDVGMTRAFAAAEELHKVINKAGLDEDSQGQVWRWLFSGMQRDALPPQLLEIAPREVVEAFADASGMFYSLLNDSYQVLKRFSPEAGHIDDFVPVVLSQEFRNALKQMPTAAFGIDNIEQTAKRLSRQSGEDISVDDLTLFMEAFEGQVGVAAGRDAVGQASVERTRRIGRYLQSLDSGVESRVMMLDAGDLAEDGIQIGGRKWTSTEEISDTLTKVWHALDDDPSTTAVSLSKKQRAATALEQDPITLLNDYVADVANVAEQRMLLETAKTIGIAKVTTTDLNVDHMLHILGEMTPALQRRVEGILEEQNLWFEQVIGGPVRKKKVDVGLGGWLEIPSDIVQHPAITAAVDAVRKQTKKLGRKKVQFMAARAKRVAQLEQKGLSHRNAVRAVDMGNEALADMRVQYLAGVEEAYDDFYQDLTRAYFEAARSGQTHDEVIAAARSYREWLKQEAKKQWNEIEDQYLWAMDTPEMVAKRTKVEEMPTRFFNPDDPVEYAATMEYLLQPLRQRATKIKDDALVTLRRQAKDLQDQRNRVFDSMSTKKNKNAVAKKAEEGQKNKAKAAELTRINEQYNGVVDMIDAIESTNLVDDEIAIFVTSRARSVAQQDQAHALHFGWTTIVEQGLEVRRELNPDVAKHVEDLWSAFEAAVRAGEGSIEEAMLNQPRFWTVLADGILADWAMWDEIKKLSPDDFGPGLTRSGKQLGPMEDFADLPSGSLISKEELIDQLEARIASVKDADIADYGYLGGLADPDKIIARRVEMETELMLIKQGDEAATRRAIINHMSGLRNAHVDQAASRARTLSAGVKVGDSIVAIERNFAVIAQAAHDPGMASKLPEAVAAINRQLERLPNTPQLKIAADGSMLLTGKRATKMPVMPMRTLVDAVADGRLTKEALEEQGLGFITAMVDVDAALANARKAAVSASAGGRYAQQRTAAAIEDFESMMDLVNEVIAGTKTAESLRRMAFEGAPHGGNVRPSRQLERIKEVLPVERRDELDRLIQNALLSDERVTPLGRELIAMQDEQAWNEILFQPLERTYNKVDETIALIRARQAESLIAEQETFYGLAEEFVQALTFVNEWRRDAAKSGTALSSLERRIGAQGEQTIEEVFDFLTSHAKLLEYDGPLTATRLVERAAVAPRKGAEAAIKVADDKTRREALAFGQNALDDIMSTTRGPLTLQQTSVQTGIDGIRIVQTDKFGSAAKDLWVAYDVDEDGLPRAIGALIGDPEKGYGIGVKAPKVVDGKVVEEGFEGRGIGTALGQEALKTRTAAELKAGAASISEQGAALGNKILPPEQVIEKVTAKASDLGLTAREIEVFATAVAEAKDRSQAVLSRSGMTAASNYNLSGIIGDYQLDPVVAAIFRNMVDGQKHLYTPEGISSLRQSARNVLNWWRPAATIARPSFHIRNLISGIANGSLIGVGPKQYASVTPDIVRFREAVKDLGKGGSLEEILQVVSKENREVFRAALEQNILSTGFVRTDLANRAAKPGLTLNPADADRFVLFRAGGSTMEWMEDVLRMASFKKYFDAAGGRESAEFARSMTMMVHFDYQNLAFLEQKLKPIAPFFVWTRRNVPLQLRALLERPGYAQFWNHMSTALKENMGDDDYNSSPLASHYGALAAPLGIQFGNDDEFLRFVFDPDLPITNLENLPLFMRDEDSALPFSATSMSPMAWVNWGAELLGPQFQLPIDWISGGGEAEYETNAPAGINEIGLLLENIDFFNVIDAEGADWRLSNTQNDLLNTIVPFYKDFTGGIENNTTRGARFGLQDDPSWADRALAEAMGLFGGGFGFKGQAPADAKQASYESSEFMNQFVKDLREGAADNPLALGE